MLVGLSSLAKYFRIALITRLNIDFINKIKTVFESKGVKFDAIYQHKQAFYSDYTQIYSDFNIPLEEASNKVLIIGALSVPLKEMCSHGRESPEGIVYFEAPKCFANNFMTYSLMQDRTPI